MMLGVRKVTKSNIVRLCDFARKMCLHRFINSGPLPVRGNDEQYSRFISLNHWPFMWDCPGMLMRDGLHPTGLGASIMLANIDSCLSQA